MAKQEKIIIRTPFPTDDEFVKMIGMSPKRRAEAERLYEKVTAKLEAKNRRNRASRQSSKKSKR
jgi:hypothetical protein